VKFVPEGRIDPPTSHMTSPGTISMREDTFRALLMDIGMSLKQHGFKNIIYIGDSGGNQAGQRWVADSLTKIWQGSPVIAHVQEYYDYASVAEHMKTKGLTEGAPDNLHDDIAITLNMWMDDPKSVRFDERVKAGKATINGVSIADKKKNAEWGKEIIAFRTQWTIDAINKAIANKGTLPAPAGRGRGGPGEE
jgi:creatinine amidohydrolase/Fe(II)-dependent formamide hydrolase-like protein